MADLMARRFDSGAPLIPVMSSKFIGLVIDRACELGANWAEILSGSLLRGEVVHGPERPIPCACVYEAADRAARLSANPYLCAEVSQGFDWLSGLPLPTFSNRHPSVGDLIVAWMMHANRDQYSTDYRLIVEMESAIISGTRIRPTRRPTAQPDAWDVAAWVKALRDRLDHEWDGRRVSAKVSDPRAIPPTILEPGSVQEGSGIEIRFPSTWLLAETSAAKQPVAARESVEERFADLAGIFAVFDYSNFPHFESFAEFVDYEPKTLQRRLTEQGQSFSRLVDGARRTRAESLLRDGNMPIQQISEALGYRNPSAFDRAFVRWHGMPPKRWRKETG